MKNEILAREIVHRIISDLEGRRTICYIFENLEDNIRYEIEREWIEIAQNVLD